MDDYTGAYSGDYNELIYLRARYYAPSIGRFLSKDTWDGNYQSPHTLNAWNYTSANPINYTDPSGNTSIPYYCLAALGLAVADGPLPFGDATALVCLLAAAGGATVANYVVNAPEIPGQPGIREIPRMIPLDEILKGCWVVIRPKNQPTPDPFPTVYPPPFPIQVTPQVSETPRPKRVLYHYGRNDKIAYITLFEVMPFSNEQENPQRARYGNGVYFTDIAPGSMSVAQIARALYGAPFVNIQLDVEAWVAVNVEGFNITNPRAHVYLVPTNSDLLITGRVQGSGLTPDIP